MTMSVSGCVGNTKETAPPNPPTIDGTIEIAAVCAMLKPIHYSRDDTIETQEQVIDYLITYETLCEGK